MHTFLFQLPLPRRFSLAVTTVTLFTLSSLTFAADPAETTTAAKTAVTSAAVTKADSVQPPKLGDAARDFELLAISGEKVKLSTVLKSNTVVLVMLRGYPGYQCPICTAQVGQLTLKAKQLADAKAQVLLVYPGPADKLKARADEFVSGKDMPANFHLLLDPDYRFTNLYGLRWDAKGETAYPSTFVIRTDGKVAFAKISRGHGDRAKVEDVLAAIVE
jgi:thioredoxin-dependent peroxiredoxin